MTIDDNIDLLTFVHPADGSEIPGEITELALQAAVKVFTSRNIGPAASMAAWHSRDHYTQIWVATAPSRQKPVGFGEWLSTFQAPGSSQRMEEAAKTWDDAQAAAVRVVMEKMPGSQMDAWVFERVPTPEKRQIQSDRRREQRF